ncbi:MAG: 50S ribosomal protein L15 [Ilumatobacteraceae bacterium]
MRVHDLTPAPGSIRRAKRVGRGTAGKGGKTAGRGTKGQRARNTVRPGFEGGQMPLKQRVPKLKGFNNPFRVEYQAVNLHALADLAEAGETTITLELMVDRGLVRSGAFVKILARGELTTAVEVQAHAASSAAADAITAAGGTLTLVELPFRGEGKAGRPAASGNQFTNR